MKTSWKAVLAASAVGLIGICPTAQAVPFDITSISFTAGLGYGIDSDEGSGTHLDVRFPTGNFFSPLHFDLASAGQSKTFNVGGITFAELNEHSGINSNEMNGDLGVTATYTFVNPLGTTQTVSATGTATPGSVSDSFVDYVLQWNPLTINFGTGGMFQLAMDTLSFDTTDQTLTQQAKITLLSAPVTAAVPEPGTIALLGLGFLGIAMRRKIFRGTRS